MMRSKITRILSYKHQKHQKNYSTFRQFSNYTHYSALFRGAKLRNSGTPKGQVTVLIYDNTLLLFRIRTCPLSPSSGVLPLTLLALPSFSRHGIVLVNLALLIWLNENVEPLLHFGIAQANLTVLSFT